MITYYDIAFSKLAGSTAQHLQEVIDHGIHNMTNDFSNDESTYDAFADAFRCAAHDLLGELGERT